MSADLVALPGGKKDKAIVLGSVVQLNSGGAAFTVTGVNAASDAPITIVTCHVVDGIVHEHEFPVEALKLYVGGSIYD